MIERIDQHPLMSRCSRWAKKQMHGQHSGFILLKYFMHARSAAVSEPPASAAFLQTGQAALKSSTQAICMASVHCWAVAIMAKRASKARTMAPFILFNNYIGKQNEWQFQLRYQTPSGGLRNFECWIKFLNPSAIFFATLLQIIIGNNFINILPHRIFLENMKIMMKQNGSLSQN